MKNRKTTLIGIILLVVLAASVALVLLLPKNDVNNNMSDNASNPITNTTDIANNAIGNVADADDGDDFNADDYVLKGDQSEIIAELVSKHSASKTFVKFITETSDWLKNGKNVTLSDGIFENGVNYTFKTWFEKGDAAYGNADENWLVWRYSASNDDGFKCTIGSDETFFCVGNWTKSSHTYSFGAEYKLDNSSDLSNKIVLKMVTSTYVGSDKWTDSEGSSYILDWDGGSYLNSLKTIVFTKGG